MCFYTKFYLHNKKDMLMENTAVHESGTVYACQPQKVGLGDPN